ncbi:MAG: hypothetical protein MI747_13275, partial [Desulfobacterales bacterium]|nr:hypothetical protein [Desulfobacterales bacterium]
RNGMTLNSQIIKTVLSITGAVLILSTNGATKDISDPISIIRPISFGHVIPSPQGDRIEIDASMGPAIPRNCGSGYALIQGGHSGLIRIYSTAPEKDILLLFPDKIKQAACILEGIRKRSSFTPRKTPEQTWIDFHLGGLLRIQPGQSDLSFDFKFPVDLEMPTH